MAIHRRGGSAWSHRWLWVATIAAGIGVLVATTASPSSASHARRLAGTPIVTYTFADVNTQGPQYKNIAESARVYGSWINAHGGINGHPLKVKFCDALGTPTGATACARKAVADHAVAVIGSFTFTGDAIVPTLQAAKTAYFGLCCALSPTEFSSPVSFPTGYVSLPATAQDYSPQVAQATSGGTDCLLMVVSETPYIAWMGPFSQLGHYVRMYGPQGNLDEKVIAAAPASVTNGDVISAMFTSLTLPAWADYRAALKKYKADTKEFYDTFGGQGTWAAYLEFAQIVKGMKGAINNKTFLAAASKAKIDLPGIVPKMDLSKPWGKVGGPAGLYRLFNRSVIFNKVENKKIVPLTTKFQDVGNLAK